jgi:putative transposase
MRQERDVVVDHLSINRWAIPVLPLLEKVFGNHKYMAGKIWRMDCPITSL